MARVGGRVRWLPDSERGYEAGPGQPDATLVRRLVRQQRELLRGRAELQALLTQRTEQLITLRGGRWHRAAAVTWALRRRPIGGVIALVCSLLIAIVVLASAVGLITVGPFSGASALGALSALTVLLGREWRAQGRRYKSWHEQMRISEIRHVAVAYDGTTEAPAEREAQAASPSPPDRRATVSGVDRERASTHRELHRVRVAAILDDTSRACFAPECDLEDLTRDGWRRQLDARRPQLLLVESTWFANSGAWQGGVVGRPAGGADPDLAALVATCRERGIRSVFWSTAHPSDHDRFEATAALFDHILAVDADAVERYDALPGERSVGVLPFAAQPRLHNPIATHERISRPAFAGDPLRADQQARCAELEMLLDAARPFGLDIYERTRNPDRDGDRIPERFADHMRGRLSCADLAEAYHRHALFLNVNDVVDSPSMCSRRVFELLACDTPIVSTPARALDELLPGRVAVASTLEEATAHIDRLLHDATHRRQVALAGRRAVLSRHTYAHRFTEILRVAGFSAPDPTPRASALVLVETAELAARTLAAIGDAAEHVAELVVGLPLEVALDGPLEALGALAPGLPLRLVHQADAVDERERFRELAALARSPWVLPLRPGIAFRTEDLRELVSCTTYAEAEVIGSADPRGAAPSREQTFVGDLDPTFTVAARDDVAAIGWPEVAGLSEWARRGKRLYRADTVRADTNRAPRARRGVPRRLRAR